MAGEEMTEERGIENCTRSDGCFCKVKRSFSLKQAQLPYSTPPSQLLMSCLVLLGSVLLICKLFCLVVLRSPQDLAVNSL